MRNAANRLDFERGRRFRGLPREHARPSVAQKTRPPEGPRGVPRAASAGSSRRARQKTGEGPTRTRTPPRPSSASGTGAQTTLTGRKGFRTADGGGNGGPLNLYHRPRIGRGHPANLSILLTGGKETNRDVLSSGERSGRCPNRTAVLEGAAECGGMGSRGGGKGTNPSGRAEARRAIPRTCSARLRRANPSESRAA